MATSNLLEPPFHAVSVTPSATCFAGYEIEKMQELLILYRITSRIEQNYARLQYFLSPRWMMAVSGRLSSSTTRC